jgi:hypothetical protein
MGITMQASRGAVFALFAALAAAAPAPAGAQDEAALKSTLEGKTVAVKLDMPATEDGIDVTPQADPPMNYSQYAGRIKKHGVAIRSGETALVTKVKVKGNLIEFQLGGGGYGTFGDETDPNVSLAPVPKSQREKDLERSVKTETDPVVKRRMQQELDGLRNDREREDRRNRAMMAGATERKREFIAQKRLQGGSRFNIRYPKGVPPDALTPEAIRTALAAYVDFEPGSTAPAPATGAALRKGMSTSEVDDLLGEPSERNARMEGTLRVDTRTYERGDERVTADFVEGVLVRYAIGSR